MLLIAAMMFLCANLNGGDGIREVEVSGTDEFFYWATTSIVQQQRANGMDRCSQVFSPREHYGPYSQVVQIMGGGANTDIRPYADAVQSRLRLGAVGASMVGFCWCMTAPCCVSCLGPCGVEAAQFCSLVTYGTGYVCSRSELLAAKAVVLAMAKDYARAHALPLPEDQPIRVSRITVRHSTARSSEVPMVSDRFIVPGQWVTVESPNGDLALARGCCPPPVQTMDENSSRQDSESDSLLRETQ